MPPQSRQQTCQNAARALLLAKETLVDVRATVGLDGFVDEIIGVVDRRHDLQRFDPVPTIAAFGQKILTAAGKSSNYELVVRQMKLGGNGPIMANALASIGLGVTYVGAVGFPTVHPVFQDLASRAVVIPIGEPGHTDALEFADGKLMLGKYTAQMDAINWETLMARLTAERFGALMDLSTLVAMVNWTMLPHMGEIWRQMIAARLPNRTGRRRAFFVDLADPEKRTPEDIREAIGLLTRFQDQVDVVLGLNLKEAERVMSVLGLPPPQCADETSLGVIEDAARALRAKAGISCVVIHPRAGAAAATAQASAQFAGPFVKEPKISTGAGDHFNAGFCLGWVLGMGLEESLCTGTATSGYYVRTAQSPSIVQLAEFVAQLPAPQ
jgi:sugar/nucleoside kinase (ribokinase family)